MEASQCLNRLRTPSFITGAIAAVALTGCGEASQLIGSKDKDPSCSVNHTVLNSDGESYETRLPLDSITTVTVTNHGDKFSLQSSAEGPNDSISEPEYSGDRAIQKIGTTTIEVDSRPTELTRSVLMRVCMQSNR